MSHLAQTPRRTSLTASAQRSAEQKPHLRPAESPTFDRRQYNHRDASQNQTSNHTFGIPGRQPAPAPESHLKTPFLTLPHSTSGQTASASKGSVDPTVGQFFPLGGPILWDWDHNMDFSDFTSLYEPQGQLAAPSDMQAQQFLQDFSSPYQINTGTGASAATTQENVSAAQRTHGQPGTTALDPTQAALAQNSGTNLPSLSEQSAAPLAARAGTKRKADSDNMQPATNTSGSASSASAKRPSISKSTPAGLSPAIPNRPPLTRSQATAQTTGSSRSLGSSESDSPVTSLAPQQQADATRPSSKGPPEQANSSNGAENAGSANKRPTTAYSKNGLEGRKIPDLPNFTAVLPAGKVFPIQIGSELFRLSGASLSSDAPSYFSHYFGEQLLQTAGRANAIKTLYIDRDPQTFQDIALHLQGKPLWHARDDELLLIKSLQDITSGPATASTLSGCSQTRSSTHCHG